MTRLITASSDLLRLLEMNAQAHVHWIWQLLRDRIAHVELNGVCSGEFIYRAGLSQESVLPATLFLLWSAPLIAALQETPRTTAFLYADDTVILGGGHHIKLARSRAQAAVDTLV